MPKPLDNQTELREIEKAYGGCHNCYGKGYATVNNAWHGYDTDQDIGSPGGYVSGGDRNAMKFCACDRGKQLEALLARREAEARLHGQYSTYMDMVTKAGNGVLLRDYATHQAAECNRALAALNQHTPKEDV